MLTCIVGKANVDTFTYKEQQLREWSNKGILKCPVCGEKMLYCHGDFKMPYFRHEKNSECPDIYSEGVTQEHIVGIKILYDWLSKQEGIKELQLEKWIPETRQRPDIYFTKDKQEYVIEFQCSPIATKFNERRDLYRLQGIKDIWILGVDKYELGKWKSLKNIKAKEIKIKSMKTKAIEREIINSDDKLIYLSSDTLYKVVNVEKIGYETKFNMYYDINDSIYDYTYDKIFCEKLLFENYDVKYNCLCEQASDFSKNLNNYSDNDIYTYNSNFEINENDIKFEILRKGCNYNYKTILDENYYTLNDKIDLIYKEEIKFIDEIKKSLINFSSSLIIELDELNDKLGDNGSVSVEYYKKEMQIKVKVINEQRIFKLDINNFKMTCCKWETHQAYAGRSRRNRPKYTTGWHLEELEKYKLSTPLQSQEIVSYLSEYFKKVLLNKSEIVEYKKIKEINNLFNNDMDNIKNRFKKIDNEFTYDLAVINSNYVEINIYGKFNITFYIKNNLLTIASKYKNILKNNSLSINNIDENFKIIAYISDSISNIYRFLKYKSV